MAAKATLSVDWLSTCSGCELGIVDLHEKLLSVLEEVDLVRMPILMDTKAYVEADIGMITGSLRTDHDIESARKMRKACRSIIAFGTCAVYGGPQGSAYAHSNAGQPHEPLLQATHGATCDEESITVWIARTRRAPSVRASDVSVAPVMGRTARFVDSSASRGRCSCSDQPPRGR